MIMRNERRSGGEEVGEGGGEGGGRGEAAVRMSKRKKSLI